MFYLNYKKALFLFNLKSQQKVRRCLTLRGKVVVESQVSLITALSYKALTKPKENQGKPMPTVNFKSFQLELNYRSFVPVGVLLSDSFSALPQTPLWKKPLPATSTTAPSMGLSLLGYESPWLSVTSLFRWNRRVSLLPPVMGTKQNCDLVPGGYSPRCFKEIYWNHK